jgi:hypothetical protein
VKILKSSNRFSATTTSTGDERNLISCGRVVTIDSIKKFKTDEEICPELISTHVFIKT